MKHFFKKKFLPVALTVLLAAAVFCLCGCKKNAPPSGAAEASFIFEVTGEDGKTHSQTVTGVWDTVGDALLEEGLIEGEEGPYGLYIKTVCGETHDYEEDGMYWAFYIDGEYAVTGVDATEIADGCTYAFRAES